MKIELKTDVEGIVLAEYYLGPECKPQVLEFRFSPFDTDEKYNYSDAVGVFLVKDAKNKTWEIIGELHLNRPWFDPRKQFVLVVTCDREVELSLTRDSRFYLTVTE